MSEIRLGDKVRFLNDVGGGVVTGLLEKQKVMVLTDDGFEVPTTIKELIIIEHSDNYNISSNKTDNNNAAQNNKPVVVDVKDIFYPDVVVDSKTGDKVKILFAFVPKGKPGNSNIDVYLINDSNYNVLYSIIKRTTDGKTFSDAVGVLEANVKEQTSMLTLDSANELPEYLFHFIYYRKGEFQVQSPVSKKMKINAVKLFRENAYIKNIYFDKPALLFPIIDEDPEREMLESVSAEQIKAAMMRKEKTEKNSGNKPVNEKQPELLEVDLHIQELLDDYKGLQNSEILEIQLERFKSELDRAMKYGPKKIVFIHGVGNGVLKIEIRKELDRLHRKLAYQDASFKEYGYGATMVRIF